MDSPVLVRTALQLFVAGGVFERQDRGSDKNGHTVGFLSTGAMSAWPISGTSLATEEISK